MHYKVTPEETHAAKKPHNIFNLNIILVHLFGSMVILEIGNTSQLSLILIISSLVIGYIYTQQKKRRHTDTWFVVSHWVLAWRRSRILLISYAIALAMIAIYYSVDSIFPGGMSMNNFSTTDSEQTPLGEIITIRFAAVVIFVAVLLTFMQTGISIYDAGKGIQDPKITKHIPRDENANEELGEGTDEVQHQGQKTMASSATSEKPQTADHKTEETKS